MILNDACRVSAYGTRKSRPQGVTTAGTKEEHWRSVIKTNNLPFLALLFAHQQKLPPFHQLLLLVAWMADSQPTSRRALSRKHPPPIRNQPRILSSHKPTTQTQSHNQTLIFWSEGRFGNSIFFIFS
eukprot:COSAG04_NODE_1645_length_6065_cov_12.892558_7_plen_127_part_00